MQIIYYGLVGAIGTLFHFATLIFLVEVFEIKSHVSSSAGFLIGAIVNHSLNRHFVFSKTTDKYFVTAYRFFIVAFGGFFINLGIMFFLSEQMTVPYILAQIFSTAIVFILTFVFNKFWTFKS